MRVGLALGALATLALAAPACGADDVNGEGGNGGTGGVASTEIPCAADPTDPESDRIACPGWTGGAVGALPFMERARTIAEGTGLPTKWLGLISGRQIARDGTPTGGELAQWSATFCLGGEMGDSLNISVDGGECLVQRRCEANNCTLAEEPMLPGVDADTAIAHAFPDDPPGTTYVVGFPGTIAARTWKVISSNGNVARKVHADTGAVINE